MKYSKDDLLILPFAYNDLEMVNRSLREEQSVGVKGIVDNEIPLHQYGYYLASNAAVNKGGHKIAWSAISDNSVEACSGIVKLCDGVYEAWAFFNESFKPYARPIVKSIKHEVNNLEFDRLQAFADAQFKESQRFLEFLGFEKDARLKNYYGKDKDAILYSIVKED